MSDGVLVTVGIPTYNRAKGLDETLRRICAQTYRNLEILVSDNNSPGREEVDQVIQPWLSKDRRIRFVRQSENIGAIRNFRFLLEQARGEYFMWAADDDEVEATYVEKQLNGLLADPRRVIAITGFDASDMYSGGYHKKEFLQFLQRLPAESVYRRLTNYARQPGYQQKARILWGLSKIEVLREAFAFCYEPVREKTDLTFAELPIEFRVLCHGDLFVVPENLFHVYLLPSSLGLQEGRMFREREIEMCRRGFAAYRRVVSRAPLRGWQKARIHFTLRAQEARDILMVRVYSTLQRWLPKLAPVLKKIWFKLMT